MRDDFTLVQRPVKTSPFVAAIMETASNGGAVEFKLNGESSRTCRSRLSTALRIRGFNLRWTCRGEHVIAWAVKRDA